MRTIVAIPSSHPGGLDAMLGAHFGHCDLYTLVTLEDKAIQSINVIPNVPHQQGACMAPEKYRGLVAHVPFVDVVTTMLDESIPLTTNKFDEWGNPKQKV